MTGTIIGMVIHFLSNSGTLNSELTMAGIATALCATADRGSGHAMVQVKQRVG